MGGVTLYTFAKYNIQNNIAQFTQMFNHGHLCHPAAITCRLYLTLKKLKYTVCKCKEKLQNFIILNIKCVLCYFKISETYKRKRKPKPDIHISR